MKVGKLLSEEYLHKNVMTCHPLNFGNNESFIKIYSKNGIEIIYRVIPDENMPSYTLGMNWLVRKDLGLTLNDEIVIERVAGETMPDNWNLRNLHLRISKIDKMPETFVDRILNELAETFFDDGSNKIQINRDDLAYNLRMVTSENGNPKNYFYPNQVLVIKHERKYYLLKVLSGEGYLHPDANILLESDDETIEILVDLSRSDDSSEESFSDD